MSYTVGNLGLNIQAFSDNAIAQLDKVVTRLDMIKNSLTAITGGFTSASAVITNFSSMDFSGIKNLSSKLNTLSKKDISGIAEKFNQLTSAITPFLEKVREHKDELAAFATSITALNKGLATSGQASSGVQKTETTFTSFISSAYNALYRIRYIVSAIANKIKEWTDLAIDYNETLNLWQVAFRDNLDLADQFIKKMTKATGLSSQLLMNYQAVFKNMLSALGEMTSYDSYSLSETLTEMALDFASLYNTSVDRAMTLFQSVLSGQVRPIRTVSGYDITENTIYQVYQNLGGTKTMRALTQTEKRLLRIYAVYSQMATSGTIGDLAKTIEQPANQLRITTEQVKELGTWIGQVFLLAVKDILPKLNGVIIALKEIFKSLAYDMGYQDEDFLSGFVDNTEEANSAVDELTGKLLSFDKFEALNSSSDNNLLGIDQTIIKALGEYNSNLNNVQTQAEKLSKTWLTILGFEYNSATGLWEMGTTARIVVEAVKVIALWLGIIVAYKIGALLIGIRVKIKELIGIVTKGISVVNVLLASGAIYGIITFIQGINENDASKIIGGIIITLSMGALLVLRNLDKIKISWLKIKSGTIEACQSVLLYSKNAKTASINMDKMAFGANKFKNTMSYAALTVAGLVAVLGAITLFSNQDLDTGEKVLGLFAALTAGAVAFAVAIKLAHGNWIAAASTALTAAGIVAGAYSSVVSSIKSANAYANGGYIPNTPGTLAMVGENGRTEIMANLNGGGTAVANIDQIEEAQYRAFTRFARENRNYFKNDNVTIEMDKTKVGQMVAKPSYRELQRVNLVRNG